MYLFSSILSSRYFFLALGVVLSLLSSLDVQDKNSMFWKNDEGYFLNLALNSDYILDSTLTVIRYTFFLLVTNFYLIIFKNPFVVVIFHKLLILTIFIFCFSNLIIKKYGVKKHLLIFISLSYLNLFFHREAILVLLALFILINLNVSAYPTIHFDKKIIKLKNFFLQKLFLGLIFFIRPFNILFFFKPKNSFLLFLTFIFILTSFNFYHRSNLYKVIDPIQLYIFLATICFLTINLIYLLSFPSVKFFKINTIFIAFILVFIIFYNQQLINFYYEKYDNFIKKFFDIQIFYYFMSSLYSLNPYSKIPFYISNGLFLKLILVFLSSLILIKFLFQIIFSIVKLDFKFQQNMQLFYSIIFVVSIYSFSKIPMDIRVFLSCLTPFFIYFNEKLLSKYYFIPINLILILLSFIAIFI